MSDTVVPLPDEDDLKIARHVLTVQAEGSGLDINDSNIKEFIDHQVISKSQMMAEIRWLRTILSNVSKITETA